MQRSAAFYGRGPMWALATTRRLTCRSRVQSLAGGSALPVGKAPASLLLPRASLSMGAATRLRRPMTEAPGGTPQLCQPQSLAVGRDRDVPRKKAHLPAAGRWS